MYQTVNYRSSEFHFFPAVQYPNARYARESTIGLISPRAQHFSGLHLWWPPRL